MRNWRDPRVLIDVQLGDAILSIRLGGELFDGGSDHPAGAAPLGPAVEQDGHGAGLKHLAGKAFVGHGDWFVGGGLTRHGQTGAALPANRTPTYGMVIDAVFGATRGADDDRHGSLLFPDCESASGRSASNAEQPDRSCDHRLDSSRGCGDNSLSFFCPSRARTAGLKLARTKWSRMDSLLPPALRGRRPQSSSDLLRPALAILLVLFGCAAAALAAEDGASKVYASVSGNDAWSGTLAEARADHMDGPVATLERGGTSSANSAPRQEAGFPNRQPSSCEGGVTNWPPRSS